MMDILRELRRNSKSNHWQEGIVWLAWSLVGGLFPVWLTIIVLALTRQEIKLQLFTDNGEFALYSASYISGTLYILFKDFTGLKVKTFPSRSILGLAFTTLLMISAAVFMVVCLINVIGSAGKADILSLLNKPTLRLITLVVFPVSMILSVLVLVTDNVRAMPDLNKMSKADLDQLNNEFNKLL